MDRHRRHLDRATLNQFWEILDKWVHPIFYLKSVLMQGHWTSCFHLMCYCLKVWVHYERYARGLSLCIYLAMDINNIQMRTHTNYECIGKPHKMLAIEFAFSFIRHMAKNKPHLRFWFHARQWWKLSNGNFLDDPNINCKSKKQSGRNLFEWFKEWLLWQLDFYD